METLEEIFHPQSIAVVGASENPSAYGYCFLSYLCEGGYQGKIYPVNPEKESILGFKAYPSLAEIPGDVDYVICCINAARVIDLLKQCPAKNVKAVHLFTGRLSETGNVEDQKLEQEITQVAKALGVRLIGPNCMGIYYPREGITFNYDLPLAPGKVGGFFQSGGISGEFARYAALRGVRFSKIVSYGNAVDLNECDFLEYFSRDRETEVIVMYLEGVKDGRRFLKTLRRVTQVKPVIVLKGGRGKAGTKSAASHTASVAGAFNTWETVFKQGRAIQTADLSELIDLAACFYFLPPLARKQVGIIGGGGGKAVLAADECEEAGLNIIPLPEEIKRFVKERNPKMVSWLGNPVDFSILPGTGIEPIEMLEIMAKSPQFDFFIGNITEDNPFSEKVWVSWVEAEVEQYLAVARQKLKPLVVTMGNPELAEAEVGNWRWKTLLRQRERLVAAGIPVFPNVKRAARAISKMITYYQLTRN